MDIRIRSNDGGRGYNIADMEHYIKQARASFMLDSHTFNICPLVLHYDEEYMHEESVIKLMHWIHKEEGIIMCMSIKEYARSMKKKWQRRAYSTTHRIDIAYKSKYKCNMCSILLPPTFEVDHIVELQDGGLDIYKNCQALCPNCHADKTRANVLRKNKAFEEVYGKKFKEMQCNAFDKFKRKSKYF